MYGARPVVLSFLCPRWMWRVSACEGCGPRGWLDLAYSSLHAVFISMHDVPYRALRLRAYVRNSAHSFYYIRCLAVCSYVVSWRKSSIFLFHCCTQHGAARFAGYVLMSRRTQFGAALSRRKKQKKVSILSL